MATSRAAIQQGQGAAIRFNQSALRELFESELGPVAKELERRAIRIESAAKRFCPVDTGRLRASISHRLGRDAQGLYEQIGTNVAYAMAIEFGSGSRRGSGPVDEFEGGGSHAQPFLRPALFASRLGTTRPDFKALG